MDYARANGLRFGKLTVVQPTGKIDRLVCLCDCGNQKIARLSHLRAGSVKSCGCLLVTRPKEVHGTYLASRTPEYKAWDGMVRRCTIAHHPAFALYGGRGIIVCGRWLGAGGFGNFLDDMGPRVDGASLDRVDNEAGYSPENCEWSNRVKQANNRRTNKLFTHDNQTKTLAEWAAVTGVSDNTMRERLKSGWTIERTLSTPTRPKSAKGC